MTALPMPEADIRIDVLWARYRSAGDADARDQLLARHLGLVHHVAREVSRRIPSIEIGELVSAGALGLMKALDSFDLARGLAFSTYAVLRIRGAILDDLRSRDSTPRSVRMKRRKIESVSAVLEGELGTGADCQGGRAAAGDRPGDVLEVERRGRDPLRDRTSPPTPRARGSPATPRTIPTSRPSWPRSRLVDSEHVAQLRLLISRLPEQQRKVLALYYYEELNLRQVGEVLQVSESRVSQIRSQALRRLKAELTAQG